MCSARSVYGIPFALFVLCLVNSGAVQAQSIERQLTRRDVAAYFLGGLNTIDVDALNTDIKNKGYAGFSKHRLTYGIGFRAIYKRIVFGCEGHFFPEEKKTKADHGEGLEAYYLSILAGYAVYQHDGLALYPHVGVGGSRTYLRIFEKGTSSFNDVMENPGRGSILSVYSLPVQVGIGIDFLIKQKASENRVSGTSIGLRAGYCFTPYNGNWKVYGEKVSGGPDVDVEGPYVHLTVGWGMTAWK
jgi:hypothetical protein